VYGATRNPHNPALTRTVLIKHAEHIFQSIIVYSMKKVENAQCT